MYGSELACGGQSLAELHMGRRRFAYLFIYGKEDGGVKGRGETYPSDVKRAWHRGGSTGDSMCTAFSEGADRDIGGRGAAGDCCVLGGVTAGGGGKDEE